MKKSYYIFLSAILFLSLLNTEACVSQTKRDTLKVLFVGNSYTYYNNLEQIVSLMTDSTHIKLITKKSTVGGAKLSEHWRSARGLRTKEMIKNGHFDIVVLQEFSMSAIDEPDSTRKYLALFCDYIKQNGAKPYLYLTWARKRVPQFQDDLNKVYMEIGQKKGATIVPVGPAWALAQQIRPGIELFNPDETHPSSLGTFLNAVIFTASITGEIPRKISNHYTTRDYQGESIELMNIDELDVTFCSKIAKQVMEKYGK